MQQEERAGSTAADTGDGPAPALTPAQRARLRGFGHHLRVGGTVGREGITPALLDSLDQYLRRHELIKVKCGGNCPLHRKELGPALARDLDAVLVRVVGRTLLLYRPNPELPREQRVFQRLVDGQKARRKTGSNSTPKRGRKGS